MVSYIWFIETENKCIIIVGGEESGCRKGSLENREGTFIYGYVLLFDTFQRNQWGWSFCYLQNHWNVSDIRFFGIVCWWNPTPLILCEWHNNNNGGPWNLDFEKNFIKGTTRNWPKFSIVYRGRDGNSIIHHLAKQGASRSLDFLTWL